MADYFEHMRRLASRQGGYAYDWVSDLAPGNGEDAYTALVLEHLTPGAVVLEAGCGHGPDIPGFAPKCARYIAYDAVDEFIAIARKGCADYPNVELITANSSARHNNGRARIPADDASLDLIISRRGPGNWIADARRACKPGAVLIQLNPGEWRAPAWAESLPGDLRREEAEEHRRLAEAARDRALDPERLAALIEGAMLVRGAHADGGSAHRQLTARLRKECLAIAAGR